MQEHFHFTTNKAKIQKQYAAILSSLGEKTPTSTKRSKWEMNRLNYILLKIG